MVRRGRRAVLAGAAGVLVAFTGLGGGTAQATPGSGVTGTILAEWTVGGTDYVLREITVEPGGTTGWHYHDGTLYGVIARGTLTHHAADGCVLDGVYEAGDTIVEAPGTGNVHVGRNLGTEPLVLEVLYVLPAGAPLANDAPDPGCGFG